MEIKFDHLNSLFIPFNEEFAKNRGYLNRLNSMNLSVEHDATLAIEAWVKPSSEQWSKVGRSQITEVLRFHLTVGWGGASIPFWRPGIDDIEDMKAWNVADVLFCFHLWRCVIRHPFLPAKTSEYLQRVDSGFTSFPHSQRDGGGRSTCHGVRQT